MGYRGYRLRQRVLSEAGLSVMWLAVAIGEMGTFYGTMALVLALWTGWDAVAHHGRTSSS